MTVLDDTTHETIGDFLAVKPEVPLATWSIVWVDGDVGTFWSPFQRWIWIQIQIQLHKYKWIWIQIQIQLQKYKFQCTNVDVKDWFLFAFSGLDKMQVQVLSIAFLLLYSKRVNMNMNTDINPVATDPIVSISRHSGHQSWDLAVSAWGPSSV